MKLKKNDELSYSEAFKIDEINIENLIIYTYVCSIYQIN